MTATHNPSAKPGAQEFVIARSFNAPPDRLFAAWTDPKLLARWWGPHTFTNPVCDLDVRPGGAYRIVMRSPEGVDYPLRGAFREVVRPTRLVLTMDCSEHPAAWHDLVKPDRAEGDNNPAGKMLTTVTFEPLPGHTRLTILTRFESAGIRDAMLKMGMTEGWSQSLERLANLVVNAAGGRGLVASRVLDAPRDLVFEALTRPEHLARWWGPKGFTNTFHEFDPRPGGCWRFTMHGPDGVNYENQHVFVELRRPERLILQHVSGPRFQLTVTLLEDAGKTRLTWRMLFETAAECAKVKTYAVEANEQNFDRLAGELAKMTTLERKAAA